MAIRAWFKAKGHAMAKKRFVSGTLRMPRPPLAFKPRPFPTALWVPSTVRRVNYPSGKKGDVLTVEFKVAGFSCIGLNGGPTFKHNEPFSFQIATDDQAETDRYWNAVVGNGGQRVRLVQDKWGVSWQNHAACADRGDGGRRR
jgi:hypothetical protein